MTIVLVLVCPGRKPLDPEHGVADRTVHGLQSGFAQKRFQKEGQLPRDVASGPRDSNFLGSLLGQRKQER